METELSLLMKLFFKMKSLKRMLWFLTSRTFSKIWLPSRMIRIKESIKLHCLPTQIYQVSLEKDFLLFLISVKTIMLISENLYMDFSRFITVIWKIKLNCRSMCMSHSFLRQYFYFNYDSILIFIFLDMILIKMAISQKKMWDLFYLIFQSLIQLPKPAFKKEALLKTEEESKYFILFPYF